MHDEPVIDADNHYYEALDAFTRHRDPAWADRTVRWCDIDGRKYHVVGGRVSRAVTNATFDPVVRAGAMHDYFRGNPDGRDPLSFLTDREPIRPEYRDRDARVATLDEQGLAACWMFPTLGMIYEELLTADPEACCVTFRAFNRWVQDDWGFAHRDRIFAAPYITLADPDWAVDELQWALDAGARLIVMRPAAPTTVLGRVSPFDPRFARFWGLLDESGVPLVLHAGDGGVSSNGYAPDGFSASFSGGFTPSIKFFAIEQAIKDFLLSMLLENHLVRYPNLRIILSHGGGFVPYAAERIARACADQGDQTQGLARLKRYYFDTALTSSPYALPSLLAFAEPSHITFGSDWPYASAERSQHFARLLDAYPLSDPQRAAIHRDNAAALFGQP